MLFFSVFDTTWFLNSIDFKSTFTTSQVFKPTAETSAKKLHNSSMT